MEILFWLSFSLIFYAYIGYPVLLMLAALLFKRPVRKAVIEPKVSVIMSAFNEEKSIFPRIQNLLSQDYPEDKLEILIGSDGGADKTDEIVSDFKIDRVRFFRFVKNLGKPQVLRSLVEEAHGSILIFTDARQEFDRQAIRSLVQNFADPQVGSVSGELYFKKDETQSSGVAKGMNVYWRYEKFLRKLESDMGSMLGATGAIYAIQKRLFPDELPTDVLVDDMYIPLSIVAKGHRAVFETQAIAFDRPSHEGMQEFKRKVRTLTGNYQILFHLPGLLIPGVSPVAWQLISHKLMRLLVPFFLILLFVSNLMLIYHPFYQSLAILQGLFYGLAAMEAVKRNAQEGKKGIGAIPYMFCLLNYSAFIAFVQFVRGGQKIAWEKAYA